MQLNKKAVVQTLPRLVCAALLVVAVACSSTASPEGNDGTVATGASPDVGSESLVTSTAEVGGDIPQVDNIGGEITPDSGNGAKASNTFVSNESEGIKIDMPATDGRGNKLEYPDISSYPNAPAIDVVLDSNTGNYEIFINYPVFNELSEGAQKVLFEAHYDVFAQDSYGLGNLRDLQAFCPIDVLENAGYGDQISSIQSELIEKVGPDITAAVFNLPPDCALHLVK